MSKAASKKAVPVPKKSQLPQQPEKPDGAFFTFIKRHSKAYATDGGDDGLDRASEMWPKVSQALRNKYEREYLKAKTKYLTDMVKYEEKMKKLQMAEEEKKLKGSTPVYSLPPNKYIAINVNNSNDLSRNKEQEMGNLNLVNNNAENSEKVIEIDPYDPNKELEDVAVKSVKVRSVTKKVVSVTKDVKSVTKDVKSVTKEVKSVKEEVKSVTDEVKSVTGEVEPDTEGKEVDVDIEENDVLNGVPGEKLGEKSDNLDKTADSFSLVNTAIDPCETVNDSTEHNEIDDTEGQHGSNNDIESVGPNIEHPTGERKRPFVCKCGSSFFSLFWFQTHALKCKPAYKCENCTKSFKSEKCLKRHEKAVHREGRSCNVCGDTFTTDKQLQRHTQNIHEAEVICLKCKNVFKNKKVLRKHMKQICNKKRKDFNVARINVKTTLVAYDNSDSEDEEVVIEKPKPKIECQKCPKTYNSSRGLRAHKAKFHGNAPSSRGDSAGDPGTESVVVDKSLTDPVARNIEEVNLDDFDFDSAA